MSECSSSNHVRVVASDSIRNGSDEAGIDRSIRDRQVRPPKNGWRPLTSYELEQLVKNNNRADSWDDLLVSDPFDPALISDSRFYGLVRLGTVRDAALEYHDLRLPVGITNSIIISSDIGDDAAIHNVAYLARYIVGSRCILFNVNEIHATDHAKFGNGVVKEGEPEEVRIWMDVMNEGGDRRILPFDGMTSGDAYLWARYRDDPPLMDALKRFTQERVGSARGTYGMIGDGSVIKHSRILKDVKVGADCYIKGANKLKNLTINSSTVEPTQIGEGVELVNGIIGYGCKVFYGCKAVRFIMGDNSSLKYGARLINSFLGDNSTISCCEVLNNLIFPAHEQHHNNSFLVAAVVKGQSNIAAGVTIGSNHNSRANDNEIEAGRGFWPALSTSLKHSCRFASFVLLVKGDYPAELHIPFPFSLVSNDVSAGVVRIAPAYWWLHNMYALTRNAWKFRTRDRRSRASQHIEFDYLAPDSVEEIYHAMELLTPWEDEPGEVVISGGEVDRGHVYERSSRPIVVRNPARAIGAYREMLLHYGVSTLLPFVEAQGIGAAAALDGEYHSPWVNLGGQLVPEAMVDELRAQIGRGEVAGWDSIHTRYDDWWRAYPRLKAAYAYRALCRWAGTDRIDESAWRTAVLREVDVLYAVVTRVRESRRKDYASPFRAATFRNPQEMSAVVGDFEDNAFVRQVDDERRETVGRLRRVLGIEQDDA